MIFGLMPSTNLSPLRGYEMTCIMTLRADARSYYLSPPSWLRKYAKAG